jgi:hypothetical protein
MDPVGGAPTNAPAGIRDLHKVISDASRHVGLIDGSMFNAFEPDQAGTANSGLAQPAAKAGYIFMDFNQRTPPGGGAATNLDGRIEFALRARPATYERTGRHVYVMDQSGNVYMKDNKDDGQGIVLYPDVDDPLQKWLPTNM